MGCKIKFYGSNKEDKNQNIRLEHHYGENVWTNVTTDGLRRTQCLCFKCKRLNNGCKHSPILYSVCKDNNLALMVTRCKDFESK